MFQLNLFPIVEILLRRPGDESAEGGGVRFRRVIRLPAFMAQELEKIFDEILHF
jgi:hypothetical protein